MNQNYLLIPPDEAESAMLGVIAQDMLAEAGRSGFAKCRFRQYRIQARRLSGHRRHLVIGGREGTLFEGDVEGEV